MIKFKKAFVAFIVFLSISTSACSHQMGEVKNVAASSVQSTTQIQAAEREGSVDASFVRKVDGDTAVFYVDGLGEIKVRFLAIDTPETVKEGTEVQEWGPEASAFTADRLSGADRIVLEWDDAAGMTDAYGRFLAWVWVDGSLLEQELVEKGLARVAYIYGDYKYTSLLLEAQDTAQRESIGIWS